MANNFDYCGALRKLEAKQATSVVPSGVAALIRATRPEPAWKGALKSGAVLLIYRACGGNPSDLATLMQNQNQKKKQRRSSEQRKQGQCHDLALNQCNVMAGGLGCKKPCRLTRWCPFRIYFTKKEDGTISTRLDYNAWLELARYQRDILQRSLSYG